MYICLCVDIEAGPYNSPRFGPQSTVNIEVMSDEANGEVGFADVQDIIVQEPDGIEVPVRQVGSLGI